MFSSIARRVENHDMKPEFVRLVKDFSLQNENMLRKLCTHTHFIIRLRCSIISKFKFCALLISISLLSKLLMNYKFCACSEIQSVGTHPSGKKALIILSPSGLMASSGIRWKSSRLSKARTQEVCIKLMSEEKVLLKKNSQ